MARFYPHEEVVGRESTPVEDIQWLAGQIRQLAPFAAGTAVLCGSVAWEQPSWRSDIDIATFSTNEHPHIEQSVLEVIEAYAKRTGDRYIRPRADVITVGAESEGWVPDVELTSLSVIGGSVTGDESRETVSKLFPETGLRFADHIGSIAAVKGDPWQAFVTRFLASVDRSPEVLRDAVTTYVTRTTAEWAEQPLHRLNLSPDGRLTQRQLLLISKTENYPFHLMRRLLAVRDLYPRPDRSADVKAAFAVLAEAWSDELLTAFEPFLAVTGAYEDLVAACCRDRSPMTATEYDDRLRSLFSNLPFARIQEIVWGHLGN